MMVLMDEEHKTIKDHKAIDLQVGVSKNFICAKLINTLLSLMCKIINFLWILDDQVQLPVMGYWVLLVSQCGPCNQAK